MASGAWQPVGPIIPVSNGADGLAGGWTRLNLRRDKASRNEADLWINGKPVAVQVPLDATLSGFQVRASTLSSSYVDAVVFNDVQPLFSDGDKDGMPDSWEFLYSSVPGNTSAPVVTPSLNDREADPDGDLISNIREYLAGSNPLKIDSDDDLMPDAWEILHGLNPADARDANGDFDFDGVLNSEEFTWGTSPRSAAGNGSNIKYVRGLQGPVANDPSQPVGSLTNPYNFFDTALGSVPNGGKLVVLGAGGPLDIESGDSTTRNLTITGVDNATITGTKPNTTVLVFQGPGRTIALDNLTFANCMQGAGAVKFYDCPAVITRCRFENCTSDWGGALCFTGGSVEIKDCFFRGNYATAQGGAVYAWGTSISFQRNRFIAQTSGSHGAAVWLTSCPGEISSCLFAANSCSTGVGAAIALEGSIVPAIHYSTFADNIVGSGGAVHSTASVPLSVTGSIFWGNKVGASTVTNLGGTVSLTATTTQTTLYPGTGNNVSNPMFLRAYHPQMAAIPGDGYSLAAGSPMIDRGSSTLVPALDIDGLPRRRFLPNPSSFWVCNADRGAFDYSDSDGDNMPDGWELLYLFDATNPDDRDLDFDQDGYSNYEEYSLKTNPRSASSRPGTVIYVSPAGNNASAGTIGSPVLTIAQAITLSPASGGRIALQDGNYSGAGNVNHNNNAKSWTLVGINGANRVTIACQNTSRFITTGTYAFSLTGITISNGFASSGNGGAINWSSVSSNITLYRCRFSNCRAPSGTGGAIWFIAGTLTKCEFVGNTANCGGAVGGTSSSSGGSSSVPSITLQDNTFAWNDATQQGGAQYWGGIHTAQHTRNSFYRNSARTGGAIFFQDCLATTYTGAGNESPGSTALPGSVNYGHRHPSLTDNTFTENSAWNTSTSVTGVTGGAVSLTNSSVWLSGGTFEANLSKGNGGAILQTTGVSQFQRVRFLGNEALSNGGVASVTAGWPAFINTACVGNRAASKGGAFVTSSGSKLTLRHATLTRNTVPTATTTTGGAVCWHDGTSLTVENSLIWYNTPETSFFAGTGTKTFTGTNGEPGIATPGSSYNTSVPPRLTWDQIHLTGLPGTLNSGHPNLPKPVAQSDPDPDLDSEPRSASPANAPDAGSDEFVDTDGDGLPNWYEKQLLALSPGVPDILPTTPLWGTQISAMQYLTAGANPLRMDADSDSDGITDAREFALNLNPGLTDTNGDGTNDIDPADLENPDKDSDGDGLVNGDDAVPWNKVLHFKRVPESKYVLVPLGPGSAKFINDQNQILIETPVTSSAPYASPQGLRLWSAVDGVSRPVSIDANVWTPDSYRAVDFDNLGRLLFSNISPNPAYFTVPANSERNATNYWYPSRTLVLENAGYPNQVTKILPMPDFPQGIDLGVTTSSGADGLYPGGSSASRLVDNGDIIFGQLRFHDGAGELAFSDGFISRTNFKSSQLWMEGLTWRGPVGGAYPVNENFDNLISQGRPMGYAWREWFKIVWSNYEDSTATSSTGPQSDDPASGLTGGMLIANRSGYMSGFYGPAFDPTEISTFSRVLSPLSGSSAGFDTHEFSTIVPTSNRPLGGPFVAMSEMKANECGSGPMIADGEGGGFIWTTSPSSTSTGQWQRFAFTNPDGSAQYGVVSAGSKINSRGEILTFSQGLWRNGTGTPWNKLLQHENISSFVPRAINSSGLICGSIYDTFVQGQQAVVLLPVHVKQPADGAPGSVPVSVKDVHLCRWNSPHDSSGDLVDAASFPDNDPDRIIISIPIPHKAGHQGPPLRIHVSTDGAQNTPGGTSGADLYNDAGADIELVETVLGGGVFESKPIAIVGDKDDDKWDGGRVAQDGALNDPTFAGWPGGNLKVQIPDLNNAIVDFPIKKFSNSFTCYKITAGDLAGDAVSLTSIKENMWRLQEIYAALHERVDLPTGQPASISQAELQTIVGTDNQLSDPEARDLIAKVDTLGLPAGAIKVVFVCKPVTRDASNDFPMGVGGQNQAWTGRNDIVLCFLSGIAKQGANSPFFDFYAKTYGATVAHECGHSLRGLGHTETGGIFDPLQQPFPQIELPQWHLMASGTTNNHILPGSPVRSGKHWYLKDEQIVNRGPGNSYSKKIP